MPFNANPGDISRFLHIIEQLESSSGKNLNHKTIDSGIQAGDAAQGRYGVMPNTVDEFSNRSPASIDEDSSPDDVAPLVAKHVLNKANGDEGMAAAMYQYGHNLNPKDPNIAAKLNATPRLENYNNLRYNQIPLALDPNPYGSRLDNMNDKLSGPDNTFLRLKNLLQNK